MILSRYKALFVHVPKTGGNSIQNMLLPYSDERKVVMPNWQDGVNRFGLENDRFETTKHSALAEYKDCMGETMFASFRKFVVVRNTFDRVMSFYFSPHRGRVSWNRTAFIRFVVRIKPLKHYMALPGQGLEEASRNFDLILSFDELERDSERLKEMIGVQGHLERCNVSPEETKLGYYDAELADHVHDRFREEIAFFEFSRPVP